MHTKTSFGTGFSYFSTLLGTKVKMQCNFLQYHQCIYHFSIKNVFTYFFSCYLSFFETYRYSSNEKQRNKPGKKCNSRTKQKRTSCRIWASLIRTLRGKDYKLVMYPSPSAWRSTRYTFSDRSRGVLWPITSDLFLQRSVHMICNFVFAFCFSFPREPQLCHSEREKKNVFFLAQEAQI